MLSSSACSDVRLSLPQLTPADQPGDMARSPPGPYFSPALLYAIYAQASRITQPPDRGRSYTVSDSWLLEVS